MSIQFFPACYDGWQPRGLRSADGEAALPRQMVNLRGPDLAASMFLKGQCLCLSTHCLCHCSQYAICSEWLSLPPHPSNMSTNPIETDRGVSGVYLKLQEGNAFPQIYRHSSSVSAGATAIPICIQGIIIGLTP